MLWLLTAAFIELLDALFNELFDAVFVAFLTELLDAVFLELLVDNFAATTLPREPPLLTTLTWRRSSPQRPSAGCASTTWRSSALVARPSSPRRASPLPFLGLVHSGRRFAALSRLGF